MIDLKEVLTSFSTALDFNYSGLSNHHKRVAYMAVSLGIELGLPKETLKNLYLAAIIHDVGAISMKDRAGLLEFDINNPFAHSDLGSQLIEKISFLKPAALAVKCHHYNWQGNNPRDISGEEIPIESRIIIAVDRLDVLINPKTYILEQAEGLLQRLRERLGNIIDPLIYSALEKAAAKDSFWLALESNFLPGIINRLLADIEIYVEKTAMVEVSGLFAHIIDHKSVFTHKHSRLVALSSELLADILGFSGPEKEHIYIAGLLHDLGKLSIADEILDKPGELDSSEFRLMKSHPYNTHSILNQIAGFEIINSWASLHHEKLNGTGYPFGLEGKDLSLGSRIVAVSDVFAALVEDRPYRKGLPKASIARILQGMSGTSLDGSVVNLLLNNYSSFDQLFTE